MNRSQQSIVGYAVLSFLTITIVFGVFNIANSDLHVPLYYGNDALEWVAPGMDLRMGFHKIAPYYYSGWHEPGSELLYYFNKDSMAKLPEWAKSILLNAARLTAYNMTTHSFAENADNLDVISSQYPNVQIRQFPESVIHALKESNAELILQERTRSPLAEKIIASRETYLTKARAWTDIGQKAYLDTVTD